MIWFSDLVESAENFEAFFAKGDNKILNVRNVWLVNYRNFGDSDHHDSFEMEVSLFSTLSPLILIGHFKRRCKIYGRQ